MCGDAAVNFNVHGPVTDHRAQGGDLVRQGDELLPAKAGVNRHDANQIDRVQQVFNRACRGAGVQRHTRLGARAADRLHRAVNVGSGFDMGGDDVGTGICKCVDIGIDGRNHQVNVHDALDMGADGGAGGGAKADVGHKMTIHHIHMYPVSALCLNCGTFSAKIGKISGKD